jgi:hypothetical protein
MAADLIMPMTIEAKARIRIVITKIGRTRPVLAPD